MGSIKLIDKLNESLWKFRNRFSSTSEYEFDSQGEICQNCTPIQWTYASLLQLCVSGVIGSIIGIFVTFSINTALIEVSLSSSFATYFGILFVIVGLVILWRTFAASNVPLGYPDDIAASRTPRRHLIIFACLNIVTGTICVVLGHRALLSLPGYVRFLAYGLLGMSAAFALTFGIVDIVNLVIGFCRPGSGRPLVESVLQIYVVIGFSLIMGAIFGALFALVDVNPSNQALSAVSTVDAGASAHLVDFIDQRLCISIGLIWGGLVRLFLSCYRSSATGAFGWLVAELLQAGLANEYIGKVEANYNKLDQLVNLDRHI